jgi:hypothetical protein
VVALPGPQGRAWHSFAVATAGRTPGNLASGFILALGIIAALHQLHIAPSVVDAILYADVRAVKAAAARYDAEKPRIAAAARTAPGLTRPGPPGHASPPRTGRDR